MPTIHIADGTIHEPHRYYADTLGSNIPNEDPTASHEVDFGTETRHLIESHAMWVRDGIDDVPAGENPVDDLRAVLDSRDLWVSTAWASTADSKGYLSDLLRLKRYYLASVPPAETELVIVEDTTAHGLRAGTHVRVLPNRRPLATVRAESGYQTVWPTGNTERAHGAQFYVRSIESNVTVFVATRDVAPWWPIEQDYDGANGAIPEELDSGTTATDFTEGDRVVLINPVPGTPFQAGMLGTIIGCSGGPMAALEVKFDDPPAGVGYPHGGSWSANRFAKVIGVSVAPPASTERTFTESQVRLAFETFSEVYNEAAEDRDWCSEAEQVTGRANRALAAVGLPSDVFSIAKRQREHTVEIRGSILVPFTMTVTVVEDRDASEETLVEEARRKWNRDPRSAQTIIDELRSGSPQFPDSDDLEYIVIG